jgi:hypothetical protein
MKRDPAQENGRKNLCAALHAFTILPANPGTGMYSGKNGNGPGGI